MQYWIGVLTIVGIYMIGTIAVNTLVPAGKTDIVAGIMQAMKSGAETLGAPWLLPLMAVCLFFGAVDKKLRNADFCGHSGRYAGSKPCGLPHQLPHTAPA